MMQKELAELEIIWNVQDSRISTICQDSIRQIAITFLARERKEIIFPRRRNFSVLATSLSRLSNLVMRRVRNWRA